MISIFSWIGNIPNQKYFISFFLGFAESFWLKRCKKIISLLGKPIIATSANVSGEKNPNDFDEISQKIIDGVDFVTKMKNKNKFNQPSRIISIDENDKILEHRSWWLTYKKN